MYAAPALAMPTEREMRLKFLWAEVRARVLAYLTTQAQDEDAATARDAQQVWTTFEACFKFMSMAESPTRKP